MFRFANNTKDGGFDMCLSCCNKKISVPLSADRSYNYDPEYGIRYHYVINYNFHNDRVSPFAFIVENVQYPDIKPIFNCQLMDTESELTIRLENVSVNDVIQAISETGRVYNPERLREAVKAVLARLISDVYKCEHGGERNFRSRIKGASRESLCR